MSYPDPPQQPQWQQPQQPGQGFPQHQGPGQPHFAPPQQPGGQYPGQQYQGQQYSGAPMGPGQGGPGGPGQPPYGGQYSGGRVPPSGGGRKWLIPAAAGVALAVMGGTLWAAVSLVSFGGPQPESVLPGNTVAFAKADLDIDGSQVIDLLRFVDKLPDEITEETGDLDEDTAGAFAEVFAEAFDLNQSEVEEWIGNKVGGASWPATNPEAAVEDGMAMALALSVEDTNAAEAQFEELRETDDLYFEMVDDFVVFTDSEAGISDYNDQMSAHGDLESNDTYSGDLGNVPSGSIALAWMDLGEFSRMSGLDEEFTAEFGSASPVEGRMTASVRVDGDYLEARVDVFGFEVENEDLTWLADAPGASLEAMGGLPSDTVMAFGGSGLDESLSTAWEEDGLPFLNASDRSEAESFFSSVGAPLPDGFTSLLGSSTAFGLTDFDPNSYGAEPSFEYRAVDGDERAINGFLDEVFNDPYSSSPMPSVSTDGDAVVVTHGRSGSSGQLGEDEVFQQTMQEMDDAVLAGYFDLRQVLSRDEVDSPDQWGAFGVGVSVVEGGQRAVVELRWAPSGG